MSTPEAEAALAGTAPIPRGADGPVFPAPWAARAFAIAVILNERGIFGWSEWAEMLGPAVFRESAADPADPEAYWRAWLAALQSLLECKQIATPDDLRVLQEAWRRAGEATPHGQPVELGGALIRP